MQKNIRDYDLIYRIPKLPEIVWGWHYFGEAFDWWKFCLSLDSVGHCMNLFWEKLNNLQFRR